MKKPQTAQEKRTIFFMSTNNYYKEIGEQAAVNTFTKKKITSSSHKIINSQMKSILTPKSKQKIRISKDFSCRDVSHIRDRLNSPPQKLVELATDLEAIKKVVYPTDSLGSPTSQGNSIKFTFRKDFSLESLYKNTPNDKLTIDKLFLGPPSGRQECENLKKWYDSMREAYCKDQLCSDNQKIINQVCIKEIIRQVSVNCIERGALLAEVSNFYSESLDSLLESLKVFESKCKALEKTIKLKYCDSEKDCVDKIEQTEKREEVLNQKIQKKNLKIRELKERIERQQEIIEDFERKYTSDELYGLSLRNSIKKFPTNSSPDGVISPRPVLNRSYVNQPRHISIMDPQITPNLDWDRINTNQFTDFDSKATQTDNHHGPLSNSIDTGIPGLLICPIKAILTINANLNLINILEKSLMGSPGTQKNNLLHDELFKRQNSKILKPKSNTRKETNLKLNDLEKNLIEKQLRLSEITKKITEKQMELDFLCKTFDYKKFKQLVLEKGLEYGSILDEQYEKILQKKHLNRSQFSILSDLNYWEEPQNKSFEKVLKKQKSIPIDLKEPLNSDYNHQRANKIHKYTSYAQENDLETLKIETLLKQSVSPMTSLADFDLVFYKFTQKPKKTTSEKILQKVCHKAMDWIISKANTNRKLINKLMLSLYLSYYSKADYSEEFIDFVYFDFYQRYGLKFICDKKFIEFVCSLIASTDSNRSMNFIRFIGAGYKVNKKNYSKKALQMYLQGLTYLLNYRNAGFDPESSDKVLVSLSAAVDLVRNKLEDIEISSVHKIIALIEAKSVAHPKKINFSETIDSEIVLELILEVFESLDLKYVEAFQYLVNVIKFNEYKDYCMKYEISMLIRALCPGKLEKFELEYDNKVNINLHEVCIYCIDNQLFLYDDIKLFYQDQPEIISNMQAEIDKSIENLLEIIKDIDKTEYFMKTIPKKTWELKLKNLTKGVPIRNPSETMLAHQLYCSELNRIQANYL